MRLFLLSFCGCIYPPVMLQRASLLKITTEEWIKKMWYRYIMEYYSAIKKRMI